MTGHLIIDSATTEYMTQVLYSDYCLIKKYIVASNAIDISIAQLLIALLVALE